MSEGGSEAVAGRRLGEVEAAGTRRIEGQGLRSDPALREREGQELCQVCGERAQLYCHEGKILFASMRACLLHID